MNFCRHASKLLYLVIHPTNLKAWWGIWTWHQGNSRVNRADMTRKWTRSIISGIMQCFLFICISWLLYFIPLFPTCKSIPNKTHKQQWQATYCLALNTQWYITTHPWLIAFWNWRVQHRFGGMQDGAQNQGGMWDMKNFNDGMRDDTTMARPGYAPFRRRDTG